MSSPATILRPRRGILPAAPPLASERSTLRRVRLAYTLMFLNTLTFYPGYSPIPTTAGKVVAQLALPCALLLALSVNRRAIVRPNVFLCLVTLIVFGAFMAALPLQHLGTILRTFRFAGFATGLWLLTPWWGRRDMLLARCHLAILCGVLCSVVAGLIVLPGRALSGGGTGRLGGAIWPVPPTQLAHYAAVVIGLAAVLWFCGQLRGRTTAFLAAAAAILLIFSHTRTALAGLVIGILAAGMSLIVVKARVRRLFATVGVIALVAAVTMSAFITAWLERGQSARGLEELTGRTLVWSALLAAPRNKFQEIFGFGVSNVSFDGRAIDSNWFASYQELGLFAVVICATILVFLLVTAFFRPRGVQRALALFLVTYCLIASVTEVGFTDVSPYLLDLTVAASLLMPQSAEPGPLVA